MKLVLIGMICVLALAAALGLQIRLGWRSKMIKVRKAAAVQ